MGLEMSYQIGNFMIGVIVIGIGIYAMYLRFKET